MINGITSQSVAFKPLKSNNPSRFRIAALITGIILPAFLFSPLLATKSPGQQSLKKEDLIVSVYGPEDGLRQSMVSQILQDQEGLMWMTTGDGLHCFDGNEFKAFRVPFNNLYTYAENVMRELSSSSPGILTISSSSSILNFNTGKGDFSIVYHKEGSFPELLGTFEDNRTLAWLPDLKLCRVEKGKLHQIKLIYPEKMAPPEDFFPTASVRHSNGEQLISGTQGIISVKLNGKNSEHPVTAEWIPLEGCQDVCSDSKGCTFILIKGKIYEYKGNGRMTGIIETGIQQSLEMFIDSRDDIWLSEKTNHRILRYRNGTLKELQLLTQTGKYIENISPNVKSIFEDKQGNIWFGTDGKGVLLHSPSRVFFERASIGFTRCLEGYGNFIWAGTYNKGLWKLSPDLSQSERVMPSTFHDNLYFLDFTTDRHGRLWIAARNGLTVLSQEGRIEFTNAFKCSAARFLDAVNDTLYLICDNTLNRFCSGLKIRGLGSIEFTQVSAHLKTGDTCWFGSPFGLYMGPSMRSFNRQEFINTFHRLLKDQVYCIMLHQGRIWAGTVNGIRHFSPEGIPLPLKPDIRELRNDVIYAMIPDREGRVWFTCNRGIGCISGEHDKVVFFSTGNNIQSLEFNYNAACTLADGKIFFGGIQGVNGLQPSLYNQKKKQYKVRMLELFTGDSSFSKGIPPQHAHITLNRKSPHISGKVYASDFSSAGAGVYSFFLEGYQQKWSKPSASPEFSYRDLPPGEYRLLVRYADVWLNWSEPETMVSVTLKPPFWKTVWFLTLFIVMIAASTALIVKKVNSVRFRRRISELEQQHAIEKERLRISKDMHDEIGASLTRISILSELAKSACNEPVQSKKIISQISEIAGNVVDEMSEIIWAMNPRNDHLDSFASYIRRYASSYLETAEIKVVFDFPDKVTAIPMTSEMRRNLFLIVKEALHNVVKHSDATAVRISLYNEKSLLSLSISDNGAGFSADSLSVSGNGLHNMQRRAEDCGGRYNLHSEPGKGTLIELSVRL